MNRQIVNSVYSYARRVHYYMGLRLKHFPDTDMHKMVSFFNKQSRAQIHDDTDYVNDWKKIPIEHDYSIYRIPLIHDNRGQMYSDMVVWGCNTTAYASRLYGVCTGFFVPLSIGMEYNGALIPPGTYVHICDDDKEMVSNQSDKYIGITYHYAYMNSKPHIPL